MSISISQRVDDLIGRMTLAEKLAQLTSCSMQELLTDGKLDGQKLEKLVWASRRSCTKRRAAVPW